MQERDYERVAKGVYFAPDAWQDDLYIISLQYKKIVYSHDTALYLLGLSEWGLSCFNATVHGGYKVGYKGKKPLKKVMAVEAYNSNSTKFSGSGRITRRQFCCFV